MGSAAASASRVAQATLDALRRGNAIDAVVTGVLVAAASFPTVLLGPVQILAAGPGMGLVAIDGRVQQPGRGAPRPRGFLPNETIPDGAYVGVPVLPAALAAALGSMGTWTFQRALGPARSFAKVNAPERMATLEVLAKRGGLGLAYEPIAVELLGVGGRTVGGLLTRDDLVAVRPVVTQPSETRLGPCVVLKAPWVTDGLDASAVQIVAASDSRGGIAIACYETCSDGIPISSLGVQAPRYAAPVLRGQRRVSPQTPRPTPAPMGLIIRSGVAEAAIGVAHASHPQRAMDALLTSLATSRTLPASVTKIAGHATIVVCPHRRARSTP